MSTTLRPQPTLKSRVRVGQSPKASPHSRAVLEAVRDCYDPIGWRKKDLLRGRTTYLDSLFALLRDLRTNGSTPAEIEGVLIAIYNAGRAIATAGLPAIDESVSDALRAETEAEGEENLATMDYLHHPSAGTRRQLRAAFIASIERQRHLVDLLDAEELHSLEVSR